LVVTLAFNVPSEVVSVVDGAPSVVLVLASVFGSDSFIGARSGLLASIDAALSAVSPSSFSAQGRSKDEEDFLPRTENAFAAGTKLELVSIETPRLRSKARRTDVYGLPI
jgi:hypothetical protein